MSAGVPEPRAGFFVVIAVLAIAVVRRMRRAAAIAALSPLMLSWATAARATTLAFVYSGSFEWAYPEIGSPFEHIAAGTPWTARILFDDAAENLYPPHSYGPYVALYQGISFDLNIGDSLISFAPVWIAVSDNCCEGVRSGHFYDGIDVTAGSSTEVYLGLYDPTLAVIHSTELPAQINLADWSNRDIVFSVGGYFTGPITDITSHIVPEPPAALLLLPAAFVLLLWVRSRQPYSPSLATSLITTSLIFFMWTNLANAAMYYVTNVSGLVSAIDAANQNAEPDTISLAPGGTFTLAQVNNSTHGDTGLPLISATQALTIVGNGSIIERSAAAGTPNFRLFDVAPNASLALENLTLQGGLTSSVSPFGGAILNSFERDSPEQYRTGQKGIDLQHSMWPICGWPRRQFLRRRCLFGRHITSGKQHGQRKPGPRRKRR
jgi:hypothetical protein